MALVMLIAFSLVGARLFYLQVVRHEDLGAQAESNRTAIVPIVPNRGLILDRNGVVLATNYSAYTLEITPSRVDNLEETIDALAKVVEIQHRDRRRFKKLRDESRSFESLPIRTRRRGLRRLRPGRQAVRGPGGPARWWAGVRGRLRGLRRVGLRGRPAGGAGGAQRGDLEGGQDGALRGHG